MSDVAMKLADEAASGDASGSASPWPEEKPPLSGKEKSKMEDTIRRFRYLLGLTDLFKHFIDIRSSQDPGFRKLIQETEASTKRKDQLNSGNHRRRKTEKEEDSELLEEERDDSTQTTVFTESPPFIHGVMRDYQIQGLNWLINLHENGISGILADEMGLGKTLQSISFLAYLRYVCGIKGPHIIIVPKSTLDNWAREFAKWTPDVNFLVFQGDKHERAKLVSERLLPLDFDVCITSYEVVIREKSQLRKISWEYIIIDEAHRIKNEDSMLSQIIRLFTSRNRLLITGTPLQNNLHELWALLNFILPDVFADSQTFDRWFEDQSDDQDAVVKQLHKVLKPFLLRRVKSDVEKSLLPKKEVNLYVGMSDMQKRWYRKILEKDIDAVNGAVGKRESKTRLLNIVMQLRKCCNHPYLFEGAEPGPPYTTDVHLIENAGKMVILDKLLRQLKEKGSRVLIFSQMSRLLDILEDYCSFRDYEYCRIDGSTDHADRIAAIDDYNRPGSEKFVFLLTTRAGGLGINLTSADTVVLYDSDWNPQADLQAMDRAHRIGQTKQVRVFRFVSENTVEEKVLERATQKLRLDQLVIQQGRSQTNKTAQTSKDDLLNMIQFGAEAMFDSSKPSSSTAVNGDDDIEEILHRSEAKTTKLNERYSKLGIDDLQKFSSDSAYEWNGEDFKKKNTNIGVTWIAPSKREAKRDRGDTNYSIEGYYKGALHTGGRTSGPAKLPKPPRQINIQDHHFFPKELAEIQHRETLYFRKENGIRAPLPPPGPGKHNEDDLKEREAERDKAQKEIDQAEPVTEEDEKRKNKLASEGYSNWTRRDFTHFIHLSAKYGRHNYKAIASELEGKTEQEVRQYTNTFWKRYKEIDGYERYISQIETGEERAKRVNRQRELLAKKINQYKSPLRQMQIRYPQNNSKRVYTEEEDRFLLIQLNRIGLDNENVYELIRDEIRKHPLFRFDWFFLSRVPIELSRRCSTLLTAVVRELDGPKKRRSVAYDADGIVEDEEEDENPDDDYEEDDEEDIKPSHNGEKSSVNGGATTIGRGGGVSSSRSPSVASDMPPSGHNRKKARLE